MKTNSGMTFSLVTAAAVMIPCPAYADAGYFQIGYGSESRSAAGAAAAATRDAFGGASNPATTVWVGNRLDGAIALTGGQTTYLREAGLPGPLSGLLDTRSESRGKWELLGDLAYNYQLRPDLALSVVGYSNGAGAFLPADTTLCPTPLGAPVPVVAANALCGSGKLGSSLKQFTIAPTVSHKLSDSVSIGGSLLLTGQQYKAEGHQAFSPQSANPAALTNTGRDYAYGVGIRVGGYWRVSSMFSAGASWSPKTRMSKLEKYEGLLPDGGRLDIPENFLAGVQISPTEALSILLDYQRINYADAAAFGNRPFNGTALRGAAGGPGLGWKNMDIYKLGVRYAVTPQFRLSAGVSTNTRAFDEQDSSDNITTPSTFRSHYTLGLGYSPAAHTEWSLFYGRSAGGSSSGSSALASAVASQALGTPTTIGRETLRAQVQTIGLQLSRSF